MEEAIHQFTKYYEEFDKDDAIERKYYHSLRVMDLSKQIAKSINLSEYEIHICSIIGLLHDYARFQQWREYHTYSDTKSIDHGDLAVKMLFEENSIIKYINDTEYYDIIYNAIKHHNKLNIPDGLNEKEKLFCKIVRDADKLDIFYIKVNNTSLMNNNDEEISEDVIKDFYQNKSINTKCVKTDNDHILLLLALVFDINFNFSFKYLIDNNFIWDMYNNIANKDKFKKYFEYADNYIKSQYIKSENI